MHSRIFLLLSMLLMATPAFASIPSTLDDMLELLDDAVNDNEAYISQRFSSIDSLKRQLIKNPNDLSLYGSIGNNLKGVAIDSALCYYDLGIAMATMQNDAPSRQYLEIQRSATLPIMGITKESIEMFDSIESRGLYPQNRATFYECGNRLFFYISSFYPDNFRKNTYSQRGLTYTDSLLTILPKDSPLSKLYQAQVNLSKNNRAIAVTQLDELIKELPVNDNLFARAASMRAICDEGIDHQSFLYHLALSAYSDIIGGTREATSLQRLGVALYDEGDISRAYKYLLLSLDNAVKSGARIRATQSSEAMPYIAQSFHDQDKTKMIWLSILIALLSIALIGIVLFILYLGREKDKLEIMKLRLTKANYAKETYMSQFLSLCSIYLERFEAFNKHVHRKITAGQIEDLANQVKSGKIIQEQSEQFYTIFDDAFSHIYPTFVSEVNALLQEDKKITLADNQKLNTELRILAFMRLGIDDSSQIARFLGLSLNTIYTYRNKMKSRAINREKFEEEVLLIGRIR